MFVLLLKRLQVCCNPFTCIDRQSYPNELESGANFSKENNFDMETWHGKASNPATLGCPFWRTCTIQPIQQRLCILLPLFLLKQLILHALHSDGLRQSQWDFMPIYGRDILSEELSIIFSDDNVPSTCCDLREPPMKHETPGSWLSFCHNARYIKNFTSLPLIISLDKSKGFLPRHAKT